jgi:hypothetical protein
MYSRRNNVLLSENKINNNKCISHHQPFVSPAGNAPQEKQSLIFDDPTSFLVATNVVQKPFNNELHFEVNQFKIKFMLKVIQLHSQKAVTKHKNKKI